MRWLLSADLILVGLWRRLLPCILVGLVAAQFVGSASRSLAAEPADLATLEEQTFAAAVQRVAPGVVRIETFGGLEQVEQVLVGDGPTTGLIVSADGLILSSAFNFARQPASILVTLPGGERTAGTLVARDHSRRLVLLKVNVSASLPVPLAAPVGELQVGQWTIAVGRALDAAVPNVSVGVLSARDRIWGRAVQTDAKISPSNYGGPLIDVRGRVIGILSPLSPEGETDVAGAEWYDSGIGFAVPLEEMLRVLDRLKTGTDLHPGLLGITIKGDSIYASKPYIATCRVKSPARAAGLQPDDLIVEVDGRPVSRHTHLKHALGTRYGGDRVRLVVQRGDQRLPFEVELVNELLPYEHPFLGVLPERGGADRPGVAVRYVYADSGADQANLAVGDRITTLNGTLVVSADSLRVALAQYEPETTVSMGVARGNEVLQRDIKLGRLPTELPLDLLPVTPPAGTPAVGGAPVAAVPPKPPPTLVDIKIPEAANGCFAYVPTPAPPGGYGVLVDLRAPGPENREDQLGGWRDLCDQRGLIFLAPQPRRPERWEITELEFIRSVLDRVLKDYPVDAARVVVSGREAGGTLGFVAAFRFRDRVRGLIAIDAPPPQGMRLAENEPNRRLAILLAVNPESRVGSRVEAVAELLKQMKYPASLQPAINAVGADDALRADWARWIDSLDRI